MEGMMWRKGPWTPEEDKLLAEYVNTNGEGRWSSVARSTGLNRNGKSCRLRWVNYLRPGLKRSHLTPQEQGIIIELHALWGNKWSTIARYLPGRTDNEIKNYWRTHFKKKGTSTSRKEEQREIQLLKDQEIKLHLQNNDMFNNFLPTPKIEGNESLKEQISQVKQKTTQIYPNMDDNYTPLMCHNCVAPWPNTVPLDDFDLWGGLWNIDTPCGKIEDDITKISMPHQGNICSSDKFSSWPYNGEEFIM